MEMIPTRERIALEEAVRMGRETKRREQAVVVFSVEFELSFFSPLFVDSLRL